MSNGWDECAAAWIADMSEAADFGRACGLDAPMLAQLRGKGFRRAPDVGCGDGRLRRRMLDLSRHFDDRAPRIGFPAKVARDRLVPRFHVMERKGPGGADAVAGG